MLRTAHIKTYHTKMKGKEYLCMVGDGSEEDAQVLGRIKRFLNGSVKTVTDEQGVVMRLEVEKVPNDKQTAQPWLGMQEVHNRLERCKLDLMRCHGRCQQLANENEWLRARVAR